MSLESPNIESDTFSYRPSEEQQEKMEVLKSLLSTLQEKEVKFAIAGGYGLDALYGSLTRDHNDYDFVVFDENISDFESVVVDAAFTRVATKESGTVVFTHPKRNIKLEYMPASKVQAFLNEADNGVESTLNINKITKHVLEGVEVPTFNVNLFKKFDALQNSRFDSPDPHANHKQQVYQAVEKNL